MSARLRSLGLALAILAGCGPLQDHATLAAQVGPPEATPAEQIADNAQRAIVPAADVVADTAFAVVEAFPLPPPAPRPEGDDVSERAVELIIAFEVGSPELYTRRYQAPIWPGASSGATIGIGYDLGHQFAEVIVVDWEAHPHAARLATAAGITGPLARDAVRRLADITVDYGLARRVFDQTNLVQHCRIARRVFGDDAWRELTANARGALCSLVFNRGGSMHGAKRAEMRAIRDECMPNRDGVCIARYLRAMVRHWVGTSIENGMRRRRYAEAELAEAA